MIFFFFLLKRNHHTLLSITDDEKIHLSSPEMLCEYESMVAAQYRLQQQGIDMYSHTQVSVLFVEF